MNGAKCHTTGDPQVAACPVPSRHASLVTCHSPAFTLIELLVVISIMGLIAALAVPALKNLGKGNVQASAARQLLDDIGHARQLAIGNHTTVYMVFVRPSFWMESTAPFGFANNWWVNLTPAQQAVATNLCDKQLTGYTFVSLRSAGDQPGQGQCRYLSSWQTLPDGNFIAPQKFTNSASSSYVYGPNNQVLYQIYGFCVTNIIPFPTESSPSGATTYPTQPYPQYLDFDMPYIAFNYLGQLTFDGLDMANRDEYIPLAQGSVTPAMNLNTKTPIIASGYPPAVYENPPGNSTNSMYNIIHIDRLTGRATLEYQHVQ